MRKNRLVLIAGAILFIAFITAFNYGGCINPFNGPGSGSSSGSSALYEALGITNTAFGLNGVVTTTIGTTSYINRIARQTDGKIVATGYSDSKIALARYTITGTLDTTFDTDGIVTNTFGTGAELAYAIAIQTDGKIIVAGCASNGANIDFALARYTITGTLDTTFDTDGVVTYTLGTNNFYYDLAIQADGKIVAAGTTDTGSGQNLVMLRYDANGALDDTFGISGVVTTTIGTNNYINRIALQPDGKIVVAGNTTYGADGFVLLARYTTAGVLDTTFSSDGVITHTVGTGNEDGAMCLAIQPDGKIVTAGWDDEGSNYNNFVARYTAAGVLDTAFSADGVVTMAVTAPITSSDTESCSIGLQSNGKIVVAGFAYNIITNYNYFMLARYNANGTLDTTFGGGDGMVIDLLGSTEGYFADMLIQPDGLILGAGFADNKFTLVQFK